MIKNIIWEVDGVLFDTHPAITYAVSQSLNDLGQAFALNEIDSLTRQSIDYCLSALSKRFKLDPGLLRLRFEEASLRVSPERQPLQPGARDLCAYIDRQGMNIIATHRSIDFTKQLLGAHALARYVVGIVSVTEGYAHKPDPAMFLAALEKFELRRADTLIIGSQEIDLQAGLAAGLQTCLLGSAPASDSVNRFDTLGQVLKWLRSQK